MSERTFTTAPGSDAAPGTAPPAGLSPAPSAPPAAAARLSLTDFLDVPTLQSIQDSFTALTRLCAVIADADGRPITAPSRGTPPEAGPGVVPKPPAAHAADAGGPAPVAAAPAAAVLLTDDDLDGATLSAPILVEGQKLGSIIVESRGSACAASATRQSLRQAALDLGLPADRVESLLDAAEQACSPRRSAAVAFLHLMANSLAQLCYQESQLRRRVEQLSTLYEVSRMLSARHDLQQVLDAAARSAAEALGVKAAMIRLLDDDKDELVPRAVYNLSAAYLNKGPILVDLSEIFREAVQGQVVAIHDMSRDPRILYRQDASREGLASMLVAGMVYQGQPVGLVQLYTAAPRRFSTDETNLLRAVAQLMAAAITTARLEEKRREAQNVQRQLRMAADVQKRMLPHALPAVPGFDLAARYVPSYELGGDFYDLFDLQDSLGIVVADVAGKGVPASLMMAAVRSSLRAYAQDLYDLDHIIARVNTALCRDTLAGEFATLFYGVLEPRSRRFTYCNAGHEPPLLLRGERFIRLDVGGMVVGVDRQQRYDKSLIDLQPGDMILFHTDGLTDALNFDNQRFGRERIMRAMLDAADKSAADALAHILWEMRRFVGLNRLIDDTTLVVLKCLA